MKKPDAVGELLERIAAEGLLYRSGVLRKVSPTAPGDGARADGAEDDEDPPADDGLYELSFSSEEPYLRWFGDEILGHEKGEVRLAWLAGGTAQVLMDHDTRDVVGVIGKAWIADSRGRVRVRFGRGARAQEIRQDVDDGIRCNVSVGYRVHSMRLEEENDDGPDVYRVTDWEPLEVSIVAVPADQGVGFGREGRPGKQDRKTGEGVRVMKKTGADVGGGEPAVDPVAVQNREREREQERAAQLQTIEQIQRMGAAHGARDLADEHIRKGSTLEQFRAALLDSIATRATGATHAPGDASHGEQRDLSRFSLRKALLEASEGKLSGLEAEMAEEGRREMRSNGQRVTGNLQIPSVLLYAATAHALAGRAFTVGTEGGDVVQTTVGSMIGALRNRLVLAKAGARFLGGLQGDLRFPRLSGSATWTWEGEVDDSAESTPATDNVPLSPNRGATFVDISKQTLLQASPDIEAMVRDDLLKVAALGIQAAAITGTGLSNQPRGILNTVGIGDVPFGSPDGGAPTWPLVVGIPGEVAVDDADMGTLGWLINAKTRTKLMTTEKSEGTGQFILPDSGSVGLVGAPVHVTNAVPGNLVKGGSGAVCSAMIYGNFDDLLIGMWGGFDLVVDHLTQARAAMIRTHIGAFVDVALRHPQSFAASKDVLTA